MRLTTLATAIISTLLSRATPSHSLPQSPAPYQNITTPSLSTRNPVTAITLHLGARRTNVGGTPYAVLYDHIYQAINTACPFGSSNSACAGGTATFKVRTHASPGVAPFQVDVKVRVNAARWFGNLVVYKLMVGAIAGAVERGTYVPEHCQPFKEVERGVVREYVYCNTVGSVKVLLPGKVGYFMGVSLETVLGTGEFECTAITSTVENYLDQLKPEFEKALGMPEMYVEAKCIYD